MTNGDIVEVERVDIYDENGFPISNPFINEGYDSRGVPVTRLVGVVLLE